MSTLVTAVEDGDRGKLGELIWRIRVALLTTIDLNGRLHARPVETLQIESNAILWFFTDWSSPKVDELQHDFQVSLGYSDPSAHSYVTVNGKARLVRDRAKAKEIWTIDQRAYYPKGPEDERLALLRVQIERAEYWIAPGRVSYFVAAAKAMVTGEPVATIGEHRKVD